jgi:hypothetical protein
VNPPTNRTESKAREAERTGASLKIPVRYLLLWNNYSETTHNPERNNILLKDDRKRGSELPFSCLLSQAVGKKKTGPEQEGKRITSPCFRSFIYAVLGKFSEFPINLQQGQNIQR